MSVTAVDVERAWLADSAARDAYYAFDRRIAALREAKERAWDRRAVALAELKRVETEFKGVHPAEHAVLIKRLLAEATSDAACHRAGRAAAKGNPKKSCTTEPARG